MQSGQLTIYQEAAALGALRNCAGALSDLVEGSVSGPSGPGAKLPGKTDPEEEGRRPSKAEGDQGDGDENRGKAATKERGKKETAVSSSKKGPTLKGETNPGEGKRKLRRKDKKELKKKKESAGERGPPERKEKSQRS